MRQHETIKLRTLISELEEIYNSEGNIPVAIAQDEEGNGFGTLSPSDFLSDSASVDNGILVLFPVADHIDLEEIKGYQTADEEDIDEGTTDDEPDLDEPPYGCNFEDDE